MDPSFVPMDEPQKQAEPAASFPLVIILSSITIVVFVGAILLFGSGGSSHASDPFNSFNLFGNPKPTGQVAGANTTEATPSNSPSPSNTPLPASSTPTPTPIPPPGDTATPTQTPTETPIPPTDTPAPTPTDIPPTDPPSISPTDIPTPSATPTATITPT